MCIIEACVDCHLILACSGSYPETHRICDYGVLPPDGVELCRLKPGTCASSGERTIYVEPGQYSHNCRKETK